MVIAGSVVAGFIVGAGIARLGLPLGKMTGLAALGLPAALALLALAPLASIVVHELGHLAAAQAVGFRFRVLTLGPWSIIATPRGFRHRLSFGVLRLIAGQQISTPGKDGGSDRQFIVYLLGGGAANLVTAALAAAAVTALPLPAAARVFLGAFAATSVFLGILNLLPLRTTQGVATDGYNIRAIHRNTTEAARFRAMFAVAADAYSGVRPRDWQAGAVERLRESAPTPYERTLGLLLAHQRALDRQEFANAHDMALAVEAGFAEAPKALQGHFAVPLAYYFGVYAGDAMRARRYADIAKAGGYLISPAAVHRATAAAALAEARYDQAIAACERGLAVIDAGTSELDRLMDAELLADLRARARTAAACQDNNTPNLR